MFVVASVGDSTGAIEIVGPSNAIYVDIAGDDSTGTRGNAALPFLSIESAFAAAQSGDEVLFSPGTFGTGFLGTHTLPAVANLIIRGSGNVVGGTTFTSFAGQNVFTFNAANVSILMENANITAAGAGKCLIGTGAASAGAFLSTGLLCRNVNMSVAAAGTLAIDFTTAGALTFINTNVTTGSFSFVTCRLTTFRGSTVTGTTGLFTYDNTLATKPTGSQGTYRVLEASALSVNLSLTGQPVVQFDSSSSTNSIAGLNLSVAAGPVSPAISFQGTVGTIDFGAGVNILPDSALGAYVVNFSGCTITGISAQFTTAVTALAIDMTGFTQTNAVFALTAGVMAVIEARGAAIRCTTIATVFATPDASGSITPPNLKGLVDIAAGGAVAKTWADLGYTGLVRAGTAVFTATVTSNIQGADAVVPIAGKVVTGLTITSTAQAGNTAANVDIQF